MIQLEDMHIKKVDMREPKRKSFTTDLLLYCLRNSNTNTVN